MNEKEMILNEFEKWVGYCEKNKLSDLGESLDKPEHFTKNAGKNNYTIFSKEFEKIGIKVQGMPWCDTFIDVIFIKVLGMQRAKELLNGFSAYTPTSAYNFQKMGKFYKKNPKVGDIIFFENDVRIYHTGIVINVSGNKVYTIEGNTTQSNFVVANGGMVCKKEYSVNNTRIGGYGRPTYRIHGWQFEGEGWKYFDKYGYATDCIKEIDGLYYGFNKEGFAMTTQFFRDGKRYVPCPDGSWVGALLKINE